MSKPGRAEVDALNKFVIDSLALETPSKYVSQPNGVTTFFVPMNRPDAARLLQVYQRFAHQNYHAVSALCDVLREAEFKRTHTDDKGDYFTRSW